MTDFVWGIDDRGVIVLNDLKDPKRTELCVPVSVDNDGNPDFSLEFIQQILNDFNARYTDKTLTITLMTYRAVVKGKYLQYDDIYMLIDDEYEIVGSSTRLLAS